jgi:CBS domain containing-hemolysin-like protein
MAVLFSFFVILILILINGLFVAAEFSIIGVRRSRIEQLVQEGRRGAQWVHDVLISRRRTDRYVATAQLGITLASLGLGMYAEPAIAHLIEGPLHDWFGLEGGVVHTISFLVALTVITYLHVVIGEMVPKSLALQSAERSVLLLTAPMRVMNKIFSIPVTVLNRIGLLTLRLVRVPPPSEGSRLYSPDELELIVLESFDSGLLDERQQELVANILDFSEERVEEVMMPRTQMTAIPITIGEQELLKLLPTTPFSRLPVYRTDIDDIIGIVHLKDLVRQQLADEPFKLKELLRQAIYVPCNLPVKRLLANFKRMHQHMAIVMDEHGGTLGLVTLEDLIEEVVGEVRDEFDLEEEPITVLEAGHVLALGSVPLDELQEIVPLPPHEYDVHTLGGYVMSELGRRAEVGDEIQAGNLIFRVEEIDGLAVKRVSIRSSEQKDPVDP